MPLNAPFGYRNDNTATASDDGEAEVWRHERMAIEEVRALLDEMRAEG